MGLNVNGSFISVQVKSKAVESNNMEGGSHEVSLTAS